MLKITFLKLIVDIGNTRIKLALFKGKEIIRTTIVEEFTRESIDKFCKEDKFLSSIISAVRPFQEQEKELINLLESLEIAKSVSNNDVITDDGKTNTYTNLEVYKDILVFGCGIEIHFIDKEKTYQGGRITLGLDRSY